MPTELKLLARSPSGPLARKLGTGQLVYRVLASPSDPPPDGPPPSAPRGRWWYYVVFQGFDNLVIAGSGTNRSGHTTDGGGAVYDTQGSSDGGTRWAHLHVYADGDMTVPGSPPQLHLTDALPGYNVGTFNVLASWRGGSANVVNGSITMRLVWVGVLYWVPYT
jgi:hypothetical protein